MLDVKHLRVKLFADGADLEVAGVRVVFRPSDLIRN